MCGKVPLPSTTGIAAGEPDLYYQYTGYLTQAADTTHAALRLRLLATVGIKSTDVMANVNWRTINIDLLDPESSANFSTASLSPSLVPISTPEVQSLGSQIKQLLRGGDTEGALRGALENAPYGGDGAAKVRLPV